MANDQYNTPFDEQYNRLVEQARQGNPLHPQGYPQTAIPQQAQPRQPINISPVAQKVVGGANDLLQSYMNRMKANQPPPPPEQTRVPSNLTVAPPLPPKSTQPQYGSYGVNVDPELLARAKNAPGSLPDIFESWGRQSGKPVSPTVSNTYGAGATPPPSQVSPIPQPVPQTGVWDQFKNWLQAVDRRAYDRAKGITAQEPSTQPSQPMVNRPLAPAKEGYDWRNPIGLQNLPGVPYAPPQNAPPQKSPVFQSAPTAPTSPSLLPGQLDTGRYGPQPQPIVKEQLPDGRVRYKIGDSNWIELTGQHAPYFTEQDARAPTDGTWARKDDPNQTPLALEGAKLFNQGGIAKGGGTFSAVQGRTPEEQAAIDANVAGINKQISAMQDYNKALHEFQQDQYGRLGGSNARPNTYMDQVNQLMSGLPYGNIGDRRKREGMMAQAGMLANMGSEQDKIAAANRHAQMTAANESLQRQLEEERNLISGKQAQTAAKREERQARTAEGQLAVSKQRLSDQRKARENQIQASLTKAGLSVVAKDYGIKQSSIRKQINETTKAVNNKFDLEYKGTNGAIKAAKDYGIMPAPMGTGGTPDKEKMDVGKPYYLADGSLVYRPADKPDALLPVDIKKYVTHQAIAPLAMESERLSSEAMQLALRSGADFSNTTTDDEDSQDSQDSQE